MAILSSYISLLPAVFQNRYTASGHFVAWTNELLEELQERNFLTTAIKEVPVLIENDVWIDKPSDLIKLDKVWTPERPEYQLRVEDVNDKLKLVDREYDIDDADWVSITGFSDYAVGSMTLDYTGKTVVQDNDLEKDMLLITAGTLAGLGIIVFSNTATVANETAVTFMHELSAALDGTKITAAKIVPSSQYLMMTYHSTVSEISVVGDEVPIPADCEKRLLPTWLRWCCERQAMATSAETAYWGREKDAIIYSIQASRLNRPIGPAKGRRLVGLEKTSIYGQKTHPDYSEF